MESSSLKSVLTILRQTVSDPTAESRTDSQLLEQFLSQCDETAFDTLLSRHAGMVFGVCRRILSCPHDVEDAFQATFLVLAKKASSISQRELLSNWLYGVALRTAHKLRRESARWQSVQTEQCEQVLEFDDPVMKFAHQEIKAVLDEEIGKLPTRYRLPILLCYFQGQTYSEAAQQLDWPAGTVAGRLARARELLRTRLIRRGLTLSASLFLGLLNTSTTQAQITSSLKLSTLNAALGFFRGGTHVSPMTSTSVLTLAEGVISTMTLMKMKTICVLILLIGVFVAGIGSVTSPWTNQAQAQQPGNSTLTGDDEQNESFDEKLRKLKNKRSELSKLENELQQSRKLEQEKALKQMEAALARLKKVTVHQEQSRAIDEFKKHFERLQTTLKTGSAPNREAGTGDSFFDNGSITPFDPTRDHPIIDPLLGEIKLQGEILSLDSKKEFARIIMGIPNGVQVGQKIHAFRLKPKRIYIGSLIVERVTGQECVAKIEKVTTTIRIHDKVAFSLK